MDLKASQRDYRKCAEKAKTPIFAFAICQERSLGANQRRGLRTWGLAAGCGILLSLVERGFPKRESVPGF
jgi:hypothetical protein